MFDKIRRNYHDLIEAHPVAGTNELLTWLTSIGYGHLKSDGYEYGEAYWENYQKYAADEMGAKLTRARAAFVMKNIGTYTKHRSGAQRWTVDPQTICDVGVGAGQFVDYMTCHGTDVNPLANEWLKEKGYYTDDPTEFETLTFWDVIEHIENPTDLLKNAKHVFISTPIYKDVQDCLKSKHLKPNEHIWYFTDQGIKNYMDLFGFVCKDTSSFESDLGRYSIGAYYFTRA